MRNASIFLPRYFNHHMHLHFIILVVFAAFIAPVQSAQDPKTPTLDELVAKNIVAKGGAEALRSLQSLRLAGKMTVNQGQIEFAYNQTKKRPGEVRTELTLQGMTMVQAYDGKEGWRISPFQGRKDPEKMSADDVKSLIEDAEIDGPLIDWKAKQSTLEYLGTEDVDGTLAHKIKVTRKNGVVNFVYLDPDHFLEIRVLTHRIEQGAHVEVETDLGDYEKIGGVFIPFSIEAGRKGGPDKQKIVIDKAEANVPIDDTIFRFPAGPSR
jgi:outer membrane lipoprotein-sorting protein